MPARQPVPIGVAMRRHENDLQIGAVKARSRAHETIGFEHIARQRSGPAQQILGRDADSAREGAPRQAIGFGVGRAYGNGRGRVIVQMFAYCGQIQQRLDAQARSAAPSPTPESCSSCGEP